MVSKFFGDDVHGESIAVDSEETSGNSLEFCRLKVTQPFCGGCHDGKESVNHVRLIGIVPDAFKRIKGNVGVYAEGEEGSSKKTAELFIGTSHVNYIAGGSFCQIRYQNLVYQKALAASGLCGDTEIVVRPRIVKGQIHKLSRTAYEIYDSGTRSRTVRKNRQQRQNVGGAQCPESHEGVKGIGVGSERQGVEKYRQNVVSVRHELEAVFLIVASQCRSGGQSLLLISAE